MTYRVNVFYDAPSFDMGENEFSVFFFSFGAYSSRSV